MDTSSILGDAIKYIRLLQDRVKKLEEVVAKRSMESVTIVKKTQMVVEESEEEECIGAEEVPLPEIEGRIYENRILLNIQCEKQKGVLVKLLSEVENLNMIVVSANSSVFGNAALDITIVAELEEMFNSTVVQVMTMIREAVW